MYLECVNALMYGMFIKYSLALLDRFFVALLLEALLDFFQRPALGLRQEEAGEEGGNGGEEGVDPKDAAQSEQGA